MAVKIVASKPPYFIGETWTLSAEDESILVSDGVAEFLQGEVSITSFYNGNATLAEESIVTAVTDPVTGGDIFYGTNSTIKAPPGITDLSSLVGGSSASKAFELILSQNGVVANGTTDDSSALQAAIEQAQATLVDCVFPESIRAIKLDSGITLYADRTKFTAASPITLDFSGMTSGVAISVDSKNTDGNTAPLKNILNYMSGFSLVGGGVSGVTAMRFFGATSRPYFFQVRNVSADNFDLTADLSSNTFGIAFEDVAFRSSTGGTLIQCLTGGGNNYGERYSFTRAMLYNSGRVLLNTNAASTFRFINSSLDYSDVMCDVRAGRVSLESCHIETSDDLDYLFKVSSNEAASLTIDKCEFVLNAVNRTKELFDIDANVKFGGIVVRDTMISMGSGYSAASIVRGTGRAVASNLFTFVANNKPVFSRYMNKIRAGLDDANALAEFTLTGTVPPAIDATSPYEGAGSVFFAAQTGVSQAEILVPIDAGQHPRISYRYKKAGSPSTGQAKLQVTLGWLDSKGTIIGSTVTLDDIDGGNAAWTLRWANINAPAPIGTRSARLRFIKSADAGAVGQLWLDDLIINAI